MYKSIEEKIMVIKEYIEVLELYIDECEEFNKKYNTNSLEANIKKSKERIKYYNKVLADLELEPELN